jgi:hypothetical protein
MSDLKTIVEVLDEETRAAGVKRLVEIEKRCLDEDSRLATELQQVGVSDEFRTALKGLTPEARVEFRQRLRPLLVRAGINPKGYLTDAEVAEG